MKKTLSATGRGSLGDFYINGHDLSSTFSLGEEEGKKHPHTGHKGVLGSLRWKIKAYQNVLLQMGKYNGSGIPSPTDTGTYRC